MAVIGGSLGGLNAALWLRDLGCDVRVFERSASALQARGAGIAVLESTLRYPVERRGLAPQSFCSSTGWIRFLSADGSVQHEQPHPYLFSSWNAVYRVLIQALDQDRYELGQEVTSFAPDGDGMSLQLASGRRYSADLVVCADGIRSTSRQALLPDAAPRFAGYVAWRGVLPESQLSPGTFEVLRDALTYQLLPNSHILVYPIPGADGAVEPGHRLMNLVWYRNVPAEDLDDLLTDPSGHRHHVSLPPGMVRSELADQLRALAREQLAPAIAELVTAVPEPFVQAVFDLEVPRMAFGRACLIGDAAFAARPHAAAGTAKAAEDGWTLACELDTADGDLSVALPRWDARQVTLGRSLLQRTREIGDGSQFTGRFSPGDPRLIFGLYAPGR